MMVARDRGLQMVRALASLAFKRQDSDVQPRVCQSQHWAARSIVSRSAIIMVVSSQLRNHISMGQRRTQLRLFKA